MSRLSVMAASVLAASALFAGEPLALEKTIPLPGVEGRFDHAAMDAASRRLFFAALGNDTLEVLDVGSGKRLHTISGLEKPTGVLFLKELNLIVVASGGDGTCRFYDGANYSEKGRIGGLEDADNLRFDRKANRVYLGYGEGALAVINPETRQLVSRIALPKHPESFQLEENGLRIFVNIPEAQQIAVVDRAEGKVVGAWPLKDFKANFPMALDERDHRLFVGCRQPARLLVYDTESGSRVADAPLSGDIDDLFFDPAGGDLLASCGEGAADVFRFSAPNGIVRSGSVRSASGARTSFWEASEGLLHLATPHRGEQPAGIRSYRLLKTAR